MDQHLDRLQRRVDEMARQSETLAAMAEDLHQVVGELRLAAPGRRNLPGISPTAVPDTELAAVRAELRALRGAVKYAVDRLETRGPGWTRLVAAAKDRLTIALGGGGEDVRSTGGAIDAGMIRDMAPPMVSPIPGVASGGEDSAAEGSGIGREQAGGRPGRELSGADDRPLPAVEAAAR